MKFSIAVMPGDGIGTEVVPEGLKVLRAAAEEPASLADLCGRTGLPRATATDLADWLVRSLGLPFREAHHVTGALVREAEAPEHAHIRMLAAARR